MDLPEVVSAGEWKEAQERLRSNEKELTRLSEGAGEQEFQRARTGMKARLVMQGESTGARAAALASSQYVYGRPRSLAEVTARLDAVTLEEVNAFVHEHPPRDLTVVTLGPSPLAAPGLTGPVPCGSANAAGATE